MPDRSKLDDQTTSRKKPRPAWFKFFAEDFLNGVAGLAPAERGIYITLLALMWERQGPLPGSDYARIARRSGCSAGLASRLVANLVELGKIYRDDNGDLCNRRLMSELAKYHGEDEVTLQSHPPQTEEGNFQNNAIKSTTDTYTSRARDREESQREVSIEDTSRKTSQRKRPSRPLPAGFVPDMEKARLLKEELGLTRDEMNYCWQRMKDHAHATDRRQVDWDRTFASWLRKSVNDGEVGPRSRARNGKGSALDEI